MPAAVMVLWPFLRAFLTIVARPFLDPMNWAGLAVAGALVFGYGWMKGDAHGDRQCNAAALQAEIDRMKLEQKVEAEASEQEAIDTAALLAEKERKEKEDADLIAKLRASPGKCLLGDDAGRV